MASLLGVSLCAGLASARARRYVAVPIEDVQLIREVRQAPPPQLARHHHNHHRNQNQNAPPPGQRYEDSPAAETSYEAETEGTAYDAGFAPEPDQTRNRFERQSGGGGGGGDEHEYVDYGAHTGHHGAFGWYADFPVISKGHRR